MSDILARVSLVHLLDSSADFSAASRATPESFSLRAAWFLKASSIDLVSTGNAPMMSFITVFMSCALAMVQAPCYLAAGEFPRFCVCKQYECCSAAFQVFFCTAAIISERPENLSFIRSLPSCAHSYRVPNQAKDAPNRPVYEQKSSCQTASSTMLPNVATTTPRDISRPRASYRRLVPYRCWYSGRTSSCSADSRSPRYGPTATV